MCIRDRGRQDRSSRFRDKPKSFKKDRSNKPSRDGEKKSFGFKRKSSFKDRPSRDGEKKSFGFKGKSGFKDRPSRDGEKKSFGFKRKSSFSKKKDSRPSGFTNNPKYFGKNHQMTILPIKKKKALVLKVRKNLRVEIVGLKTLVLKNTVKKDQSLKIF